MSTIAGILASLVASHLGGMAIGGALGRRELFGFGVKTLLSGSQRVIKRRHERARQERVEWLSAATQLPDNEDISIEA